MRDARRRTLSIATLAALVIAGAAAAGVPGRWTPLSAGTTGASDEAGIVRSTDGVLHIVWQRRGTRMSALWETRVAPDATTAAEVVAPGLAGAGSPALAIAADGTLRAFFFARPPGSDSSQLTLASRPPGGAWTVGDGSLANSADPEVPAVSAATARDGTPVLAWSSGSQVRVRVSVDPGTPAAVLRVGGCCASGAQPAVDQMSGQAYVAWASNAPASMGVYVQAIDRTGATRSRLYATGSSTPKRRAAVLPEGRIALSSRPGATGVYLAYTVGYPKVRAIAVLQVASRTRVLLVKAPGASHVALAVGPQGRLWLLWSKGGTVFAARTNRSASRLGAVRTIGVRRGSKSVAWLQGDGAPGVLDLVASLPARAGVKLWHQQVLPGLSLRIDAKAASGATSYVFRVLDAGDPVANASVRVGKQTLTTGVSGSVTLVTSDHPPSATATKPGYAQATTSLP